MIALIGWATLAGVKLVAPLLLAATAGCGRLGFRAGGGADAGDGPVTAGPRVGIAAGDQFSCALRPDTTWCWGDDRRGQLGIGTLSRSLVPVEVTFP